MDEKDKYLAEAVAALDYNMGYGVIKEECRRYLADALTKVRQFGSEDNPTYTVTNAQVWMVVCDILENLPKEILKKDELVNE